MTERIAALEKFADDALDAAEAAMPGLMADDRPAAIVATASVAIAHELRALRLMLREEIREAAWSVQFASKGGVEGEMRKIVRDEMRKIARDALPAPIASRKAPDPPEREQPPSVFESDWTGGGSKPPKL